MNVLTKIVNLFTTKTTSYSIIPVKSATTDLIVKHITGVEIRIETDGTVVVSTPANLSLYATGSVQIKSDMHIGLIAPRIDLN